MSPVTTAETAVAVDPAPALALGVDEPKDVVVP